MKLPTNQTLASPQSTTYYSDTYYSLLGVAVAASREDIHARYKELALDCHPDKMMGSAAFRAVHAECAFGGKQPSCKICEAAEQFVLLTEANATLQDVARRQQYDKKLQLNGLLWCERCKGRGIVQSRSLQGVVKKTMTCPKCKGKGVEE